MSQCNQRSLKSMKSGKKLKLMIPSDLLMEIFSRLPSKSIARFRSVSKLWDSMLQSPYFTELFKTRSSTRRPRLLFSVQRDGECLFYSSPQPDQNPYDDDKSSLVVVTADFHTRFPGQYAICSYASGLVYFPDFYWTSNKKDKEPKPMICNPITGQYVTLPELDDCYRKSTSFFGFDPIDKQFKALAEAYPFCSERDHHRILTLGNGKLRWRKNSHCPGYCRCYSEEICINGVLYYLVLEFALALVETYLIVCFDVRSEKFKFIESECVNSFEQLIKYKGKLCGIKLTKSELLMWVLEDVEKQEWSDYVYPLPENVEEVFWDNIVGATPTGEIVMAMTSSSSNKPFYVIYFNPEKKTLQRIQIQGFEAFKYCRVETFVDHVEDLSLNDSKQLKSSIYAPSLKKKKMQKPSQNITTKKAKTTTTSGRGKRKRQEQARSRKLNPRLWPHIFTNCFLRLIIKR